MLGTPTSTVEVSHISAHGIWILLDEEELFLPYQQFPWFRNARVADILALECRGEHLYWPQLDVDLTPDIIRHPDRYPLQAAARGRAD